MFSPRATGFPPRHFVTHIEMANKNLPTGGATTQGIYVPKIIPVADDFVRRESGQREDGLRRAAFHPEQSNRLK